jgi:hypothetical protein
MAATPLVRIVATVVRWTKENEQPDTHEVELLAPQAAVGQPDLTTIIIATFLKRHKENRDELDSLLDAAAEGYLTVAQPPGVTPLPPPVMWVSPT